MNKYQRKLVSDLANERITPEHFLKEIGIHEARGKVSLKILQEAFREKSAADVEYGLGVGFKLGFSVEYKEILRCLFDAQWHHSHEDIISALDTLRDPELIDLFYLATQVIPTYLEFDENRALAVKAIWALGKIGTDEALKRLSEISTLPISQLRTAALQRLEAWAR